MRLTHRLLLVVVALLGVAALAGMAWLWPDGRDAALPDDLAGDAPATRLVDAELTAVELVGDDEFGLLPGATVVMVEARLEPDGEVVTFEMVDDTGDLFAVGQRVKLQVIEGADGETTYLVSDFRRDGPLLALVALFLCAVIGFGRMQGVRALLGLALTFVIIVGFILPAILDGRGPVAVAVVGAVAIMIVTLYLSHGLNPKTTAAVLGTTVALAFTAALAALFVGAAQLTGFTSEEARLASLQVGGLNLQGLLLAGIIIGGLGVLDDVTMSQASTVFELRRANPRASFARLVAGALTVGRDHIAATVNTLFLAYAGASLPLLILFVVGSDGIGTVVTSEIVAVEVVRTLVGSVGLIAAVPITTALAAALTRAGEGSAHGAAAGAGRHAHGRHAPPPAAPGAPDGERAGAVEATDPDEEWIGRLRDAYGLRGEDERG